jgi:hypothetical protein
VPTSDKKTLKLTFPTGGIDMSNGYQRQKPGTSPQAVNVRGFDAGTNRLRGGTRPGLSPFFGMGSTEQVEGFHLVQSLSCIVWVDPGAVG